MKDLWVEKPKVQGVESLSSPQYSEYSKKTWKEKKKEQRCKSWEHQKGSILAIGVNAAQIKEPYQKKKNSKNVRIGIWVWSRISTMTKKVIIPILS